MVRRISSGFSAQQCPVTHEVMPNVTRNFKGFHISYARYLSHYGCDTTALVLQGRVFFILNGDHADALAEAAELSGIQGCIDLFIERIDQANRLSEHCMAIGLVADPFELYPTTLKLIGQHSIDRIAQAHLDGGDIACTKEARP